MIKTRRRELRKLIKSIKSLILLMELAFQRRAKFTRPLRGQRLGMIGALFHGLSICTKLISPIHVNRAEETKNLGLVYGVISKVHTNRICMNFSEQTCFKNDNPISCRFNLMNGQSYSVSGTIRSRECKRLTHSG
jgi:hypothetical protein